MISMKNKIAILPLLLIFACSPKVVIQAPSPSVEIPPTVATDLGPESNSAEANVAQGEKLYTVNCADCHKLFAPTDFTLEQWEPILKRMQKKARLDDSQMALIHDYIADGIK